MGNIQAEIISELKENRKIIKSDRTVEGTFGYRQEIKYGFVDENNEIICGLQWDDIKEYNEGLAAVKLGSRWGFINIKGKVVIEPKFLYSQGFFKNGLARVVWGDQEVIIDSHGFQIDNLSQYNTKYKQGSLLQFKEINNKILESNVSLLKNFNFSVELPIEKYGNFHEGLAAVKIANKWGFINENSEIIVEFEWDDAKYYSEELAAVKKNNKWGFINTKGEVVIKPKWDDVENFENGVALVLNDPFKFDERTTRKINGFYYDVLLIIDQKKLITKEIKKIDRNQISEDYYNEFVKLEEKIKYGVIDVKGSTVVEPQYSYISQFCDGLALVKKNGKYGYIDRYGKITITIDFVDAFFFSEGLAAVKYNNKWGFINTRGEVVIKPQWDYVDSFEHGLAVISNGGVGDDYLTYEDGKYGFINKSGQLIIHPKYDAVRIMSSNAIVLINDDKSFFLVNQLGETILEKTFEYICISYKHDNTFEIQEQGKKGFLSVQDHDINLIFEDLIDENHNAVASKLDKNQHEDLKKTKDFIANEKNDEATFLVNSDNTLPLNSIDELNAKNNSIIESNEISIVLKDKTQNIENTANINVINIKTIDDEVATRFIINISKIVGIGIILLFSFGVISIDNLWISIPSFLIMLFSLFVWWAMGAA